MVTRDEFWKVTDSSRIEAEYMVDDKLKYLQSAPPETLRRIFHEYRFFIKYYINDLGILLYKVPFSEFKCMVAEIASDELGDTPEKTHLQLWDNFLISIGVDAKKLEQSSHPENIALLEGLSELMMTESFMYGIGLRGMGAECLCQVYLTAAHKHLMQNPYILANKDKIDWLFWDIHIGEIDIHHGELVREAIDKMIVSDPSLVPPLALGYDKGKEVWDRFWDNLYCTTAYREAAVS
jgi:hypothetical protein